MGGWRWVGQSIKVGADHHFALKPLTLLQFFKKNHLTRSIFYIIFNNIKTASARINTTHTRQIRTIDLDDLVS